MKNIILLLCLAVSVGLSATSAPSVEITDCDGYEVIQTTALSADVVTPSVPAVSEDIADCRIITISACGESVSTQYCSGGSHGSRRAWRNYIKGELCEDEIF